MFSKNKSLFSNYEFFLSLEVKLKYEGEDKNIIALSVFDYIYVTYLLLENPKLLIGLLI